MLRFRVARRFVHRLTAFMLLPLVCCAGLGLAIFPATVKDHSEPFPCQDCACACSDAATCWKSCCCMTDSEKVSWAAEHHVQPPAFVLARLAQDRLPECTNSPSCSMCAKASSGALPASSPATQAAPETQVVLLDAQLRCQGLGYWISLLSSALPVANPIDTEPDHLVLFTHGTRDAVYLGPSFSPPHPPPWQFI